MPLQWVSKNQYSNFAGSDCSTLPAGRKRKKFNEWVFSHKQRINADETFKKQL